MQALKILRDATQVGILATYVILGSLVVAFPILYSMQEGFFALLRWESPLASMKIEDSLFPMFTVALLCVILRGLKHAVSAAIDRMTPGARVE
jgi:hypothetical protein